LDTKLPAGVLETEALTTTPTADGWRLRVPVPRADRYEVRLYPRGGPEDEAATATVEGGRPRRVDRRAPEPRTVLEAVVLDTVSATEGFGLTWAAGELPAAVEPRPLRRFAGPWSVVGPFPNPQTVGTEHNPAVDSVYEPERDPDLDRTYVLPHGGQARWIPVDAPTDGYVRLNPHFTPSDWVAAYAQSFLWSPDARDAVLLLGADDGHVLWVNGERRSERQGRNISVVDDLAVPVRLQAGWNRVLLKVADLDGGWAFHLRAADPDDVLRWARRPEG
jgi:hypothetical protein